MFLILLNIILSVSTVFRRVSCLFIVFISINFYGQSVPQPSQLVAYYPFSGNVNDSSGNNYDGTTNGAPVLTTDRFGNMNSAYALDGIDDYIYFGNAMYADFPDTDGDDYYEDSFSISIWAKSSVNAEEAFIAFGEELGLYTGMIARLGANMSFNSSNWGTSASTSGKKYDGQWHQYVFVYDAGSFRKMYIDGSLVRQVNDTQLRFRFKNYGVSIGKERFVASGTESLANTYTGSVDEVRIWNVALTNTEVTNLYNYDNSIPSAPVISSFTPTVAAAGSTVTLTGTSFTGATVVSFGGTAAASFTVDSATSITAVVANGTTGSVSITTPSGTSTLAGFTYLSSNANLIDLTTTAQILSPTFASGTIAYTASVSNAITSITVTPMQSETNATIQARVNGGVYTAVNTGTVSGALALNTGLNTIDLKVTAQDGLTVKTYTITVTRGLAPTITNFNNYTKTFFDGSFTISDPTSTSTGAYTYTSDNLAVATISGNTVTITGAGTTNITVTQAGDETYFSGTSTVSLTVNSVSVTTKNGATSNTDFNYVNRNGRVNADIGLNQYGESIQAKTYSLIPGMELHLDAGNVSSYPGSGTTWTDLSGNGNNGTLINGVGYNSANEGSLVFDGANDYFVTDTNLDLSDTNQLTIQIIMKSSSAAIGMVLEHGINWNGNNSFGVTAGEISGKMQLTDHNQGYNITANSPNNLIDNNWHVFSVTVDRSQGSSNQNLIYTDGMLNPESQSLSNDNSGDYSSFPLYIGSRAGNQYFFNGNIAQVLVYKRVLTATEIQQNFNAAKARYY